MNSSEEQKAREKAERDDQEAIDMLVNCSNKGAQPKSYDYSSLRKKLISQGLMTLPIIGQ